MKEMFVFILILPALYSNAQECNYGRTGINLSLGYVSFGEGQEGIALSNGLDIRLSEAFYFSPAVFIGFGVYKYSPEENHEPSYSEARVLAFQGKLGISPFPKRFSNLRINAGPSLNFYSLIHSYEYTHWPMFDNNQLTNSSKIYFWEHGNIIRERYLGLVTELEVRIVETGRIQFIPFVNIDFYIHPFYVEYFGCGIRANLKSPKSIRQQKIT